MAFELLNLTSSLVHKQAVAGIIKYNDYTAYFGLALNEKQAKALVETRSFALRVNGRIEVGGGVINKIIYEFCDSPYILQSTYEQTLHELIEMFYYYKNETLDMLSDEELILFMKNAFDGVCQGSLELLSGRELDKIARHIRCDNGIEEDEDE